MLRKLAQITQEDGERKARKRLKAASNCPIVTELRFSFCDFVSPFLHIFFPTKPFIQGLVWFFTRNLVHSVKTIHLVHNHCMRKRKSLHHILIKDLKPFYNYEFMGRQWAWDWVWSSWVEYALVIINPPTSAIFKLSLSFHLHPVLILCCVFHPVIQLKFHCCTPAASLISVPKPSQCRKPVLYLYIYTHKKSSAYLGSSEMEYVSEETAGDHLHNAKKSLLQLCKWNKPVRTWPSLCRFSRLPNLKTLPKSTA